MYLKLCFCSIFSPYISVVPQLLSVCHLALGRICTLDLNSKVAFNKTKAVSSKTLTTLIFKWSNV